jgi:hypothetical protein
LQVVTRRIEFDDADAVSALLDEHGEWLAGGDEGDLGLLVIDTLNRCLQGGENDPEAMNAFNAGIERVRLATGAAVLALHHTPKDGRLTGRGFSGVEYGADNVLFIEGQPTLPVIKVMGGASRNAVSSGDCYLRKASQGLGRTDPDTGLDVSAPVLQEATADEYASQSARAAGASGPRVPDLTSRIVQFIGDHPRCTRSDLEGGIIGCSRQTLRDRIDEMVTEGSLVETVGPDMVGGKPVKRYDTPF